MPAAAISEMAQTSGMMEDIRASVPLASNALDSYKPYTIAAEIIACQRFRGCGPNEVLSMYQCLTEHACQRGEDLLSYRRRTTSPMLYQAAEQIAAAMQARRYR